VAQLLLQRGRPHRQRLLRELPDRKKHGGTPLVEWLLRKLRSYQQAHGTRLVDYLDLHYYAQGGSTTDVTRSLWDPTYTDPSWIDSKIQLLPRMKRWVARDYPGTKISLSEYNLSVGDAMTNALIQADTLGIFAREGWTSRPAGRRGTTGR